MNHKKLLPTILGLGIVLLLLASCASPSPATTLEFPTGKFVNEDIHRAFQFNEDGTWDFFYINLEVPALNGTYSVDGDLYTDTSSNYAPCPDPATYTWTYDGDNLTFQLFDDDCARLCTFQVE